MDQDKAKRIYFPIIYNLVNSEDADHVQSTLKEVKNCLSKGEYEELPDINLIKSEVKSIIPHFNKHIVNEGHMRYLGLTVSNKTSVTEKNASDHRNSLTEEKIGTIYKLNIKSFFIYLVNTKSDNKIVTNEKIEMIWGMYDTNKKNQIDLDQMKAILSNFNASNFLYFEKETLSEIAIILFEQLDPYRQGFITKEAFISHLLQFKDKQVSLNLLEIKKAEAVKNEPPCDLEKSRFKLFLRLNFKSVFWLIFYIISNILWGAYFFYSYYKNNNILAVAIAKFFAGIINWNMALLFLFASENFFTLFSKSFIFTIFPFKDLKHSHKICGYVFMLASMGHTLAHLFGTYFILSSTQYETLNKFLYTKLSANLSYLDCLFRTISGIKGILIFCSLLIIFITTFRSIVSKNFEIFWYLHKVYYLIFVCTFLHGSGKLVGEPQFWKFMILPGTVFGIELIIDLVSVILFKSKIISIKILESDVVEFITTKPKYFINQPGQYARINIPEISRIQYHPFTIASAPHHTNLVFYIAPLGDWTKQLVKMAKKYTGKSSKNNVESLNTTIGDIPNKKKMQTN
jgi:predicted ferric reductase